MLWWLSYWKDPNNTVYLSVLAANNIAVHVLDRGKNTVRHAVIERKPCLCQMCLILYHFKDRFTKNTNKHFLTSPFWFLQTVLVLFLQISRISAVMQLNKMMNLQPPYQLSELATAVYSSSEVLDKVKSLSGDVNLTFTKGEHEPLYNISWFLGKSSDCCWVLLENLNLKLLKRLRVSTMNVWSRLNLFKLFDGLARHFIQRGPDWHYHN